MKKALPIILAAVVLLTAVGVGVYFFVFRETPIKYSYISPGEYFVTNVKESNKLLKAGVILVVDTEDAKFLEQMEKEQPYIRDSIIFILRDQDEETLRRTDTHQALRQKIRDALNKSLETEHVVDIYFNDFVIQ